MDTDTSRAALDFVHRLLSRPPAEQPLLGDLLGELAAAFRSSASGLACLPDCQDFLRFPARREPPSRPWPWQEDPSLLGPTARPPGAVVIERPQHPLLLATTLVSPGGVCWVLWLENGKRTTYSAGEQAALALAGQALTRWLGSPTQPAWAGQLDRAARQQQLEVAAAVTRRLAHDFGNVLTGILGFTELALAQQIPANTPLHTYLGEAYRAAQTGAQFTHQLRLFSRRQSSTSRTTPLSAVLAEQEARLFAARHPGVTLRLTVPDDLPSAALDADLLHQILTALLDNAREALNGPGTISVSARLVELGDIDCHELYGAVRPGPHVEITVADTGIGLSPEVQRKLFSEPFYTTKARRRGFGLAVAYGILHAHRGGVRLHPGPEGGVLARVVVPVAQTPVAAPAAAAEEAPPGPSRGERILVVDDDVEVLNYLFTILERAGYRVEAAGSASAALDAYTSAGSDPFRLVLTDVVMPDVNGAELARRLLQRDPAVRVLFLSGHVSSDFPQQDFANHNFELLPKPFRHEQLLRAVRAALDRGTRRGVVQPASADSSARLPLPRNERSEGSSRK
jgi:signal transduction histidine kinase/FixJ family two-component response regulator